MDKIKKQFKDFWQYFRLVRFGANTAEAGKNIRKGLLPVIIMTVGLVITFSQMNVNINIVICAWFGAAMGLGICTSIKPSALSVAPFSPKQRIVFSFLSTVLMAAVLSLIYIAAFFFVLSIPALIAYLSSGYNFFESTSTQTTYISGYGVAFTVLMVVFFYFSVYAIFHLERKRNVTIATIVFVVLLEVFALVMINVCGNAKNESYSFYMYTTISENIDYLYAPWVPILVLGILSALAIAASIFMSIRRYKSDKV